MSDRLTIEEAIAKPLWICTETKQEADLLAQDVLRSLYAAGYRIESKPPSPQAHTASP